MSGQKYFTHDKQYDGNVGKIYYDKEDGSASNLPVEINWMSNINLSRTSRTKTMYVKPRLQEYSLVEPVEIDITQSRSNLVLLMHNIDGGYSDMNKMDLIDGLQERTAGCVHYLVASDAGREIDLIFLTNGNVIRAELINNEDDYIIKSLSNKYSCYCVNDNDIPIYAEDGSSVANKWYQRYPTLNSPGNRVEIYMDPLKSALFTDFYTGFDTIEYDSNYNITRIIPYNGSGNLYTELGDYAEKNNLVAVKLKLAINSSENLEHASRLRITTAVYNSQGLGGVDGTFDKCETMIVEFKLRSGEAYITGPDEGINFDEKGMEGQNHVAETEISSNISWVLSES